MNPIQANLNDLPELPFELILSYLSLGDLLRARAVSRRWYQVISSFRPKTLSCFHHPTGYFYHKNSIISTELVLFLQTFSQSILSSLKNLRLCSLNLNAEDAPAIVQTLNSFDQLEQLGIFDVDSLFESRTDFQLRLPMLKSLQLVRASACVSLTLDAPRLNKVHLADTRFSLPLVHGESVKKLIVDYLNLMVGVDHLDHLEYLYCGGQMRIDSSLLSILKRLKEVHLNNRGDVSNLFEQKERYGLSNLKIFLFGCLLNGPSDPAINSLHWFTDEYLVYLAEHRTRLAEEIRYIWSLYYSSIERLPAALEIDLLSKFTDLDRILVNKPVQDVDRFLKLLKNFSNIVRLRIEWILPQQLFDRLPSHCDVQALEIANAPTDLNFLFRLKSLDDLVLLFSIDIEFVRKVFEELPVLLSFQFPYLNKFFTISLFGSKQRDHSGDRKSSRRSRSRDRSREREKQINGKKKVQKVSIVHFL